MYLGFHFFRAICEQTREKTALVEEIKVEPMGLYMALKALRLHFLNITPGMGYLTRLTAWLWAHTFKSTKNRIKNWIFANKTGPYVSQNTTTLEKRISATVKLTNNQGIMFCFV